MGTNPQRLKSLLSKLPVAIFEIDEHARFLVLEGERVKSLAATPSSPAPASLGLVAPDHMEEISAALRPGGHSRWVSFGLRDGEPCWTEFRLHFNEEAGKGACGVATDVSSEHAGDRLGALVLRSKERAMRLESMGYLISLLSTDLYSYLRAAAGNLRAVQRQIAGDRSQARRLEAAFRAMDGATHVSQQLTRAIRPPAPVQRKIMVGPLLEGLISWAKLNLPQEFEYEFIAAKDLPPLHADEDHVFEILRALLRNATEAMPDGGLIIIECDDLWTDAGSSTRGRTSQYVRICVNDGGNGIPEPILDRVFDPCYSTKPRHEGLGLTRAQSLASAQRGFLTVTSDPGCGSTFELYLPVEPAHEQPAHDRDAAGGTTLAGSVLVFEENDEPRVALARMLAACGHRADAFGDPGAAFAAWRTRALAGTPYRAVLLGWGKADEPHEAGRLWKEILRSNTPARGIAVSAFGTRINPDELVAHGLHASLRSPLSLDRVAKVVTDVTSTSRRRPA